MKIVLVVIVASLLSVGLYLLIERLEQGKKDKTEEKAEEKTEGKEIETFPKLIDYDIYVMSKKERLFYLGLAAGFFFLLAYIFYRNIYFSALLTPLALFYPKLRIKEIIEKRKWELSLQFKEALYALSSSLIAGRSVEAAFKESLKDLALIYPEENTYIIQEFSYIIRRLEMNETVEEALLDFARRAHLEEIDSFVDVFVISKRTGGNIVEIIKNSSVIIGDKLQIKQEIDTLLAERKFEQKVLNIMPIVMILVLSWSTGDYMAPVFETFAGHVAMTAAVLLLGLAYYVSKKIMDIEV